MAPPGYKDSFPRGALIGAAILLGSTLLFVAYMRLSDTPPAAQIEVAGDVATSRALKFADDTQGNVIVYHAASDGADTPIAILPPGSNGFLRSVMRGLVQARRFDDIGRATPFTLARLTDGRLVLIDPTTDRRIDLRAFGQTNENAFARLLKAPPLDEEQRATLAQHSHKSP